MADNKDTREEIKSPEKISTTGEGQARFERQREERKEVKEISPDDRAVSAELRQEIEKMELDEDAKKEAETKAKKIDFLGEKEKIEHLLQMAREKGVVFAVQVAMKMNEPYLLDILHDTLSQEGLYKKIVK